MKILLVVPDGVGVRNYLYSSFVKELENKGGEVMLYHQISDNAISEVEKAQKNISVVKKFPSYIESPKARILRESLAYARLLRNKKVLKNDTILFFWGKNPKQLKQKVLYKLSETLGWFFSKSYKLILSEEKVYENEVSKSEAIQNIEEDFDAFNPDIVLNLHQRSPITAPIISVAKKRNIKTATVIFSWDNVPKGRLISRYDDYFVWSELMKDELALLYPEIKKESIHVVGTPQFEFYFDPKFKLSREDFFAQHGLDPNKKTICFSANDLTSPYEQNYFADVCEQVASIEEQDRPQILLRKCPVDKTIRFDATIEKYKNLVFPIDPDWRLDKSDNNSFTSIYPAFEDISLLVNTILHSELVINLGSTMAHDFAVEDKPCLYLNYDPMENSVFKVKDIYNFQHFKSMENLDAVVWINSKAEIAEKIEQVLRNPKEAGKDKKLWMKKIVNYPLENNSKLIAKKIAQ